MNLEEARHYREDLSELLGDSASMREKVDFLKDLKETDPNYIESRSQVIAERNPSLFSELKELDSSLVPSSFSPVEMLRRQSEVRELTPEEEYTLWGYEVAQDYDTLKNNEPGNKKRRRQIVRQATLALIDEPQRIRVVDAIWKSWEKIMKIKILRILNPSTVMYLII